MRAVTLSLTIAILASASCRKSSSSSMSSTFPSAAAASTCAGTFITSLGTFESTGNQGKTGQIIDYRLILSQNGKDLGASFHYEMRPSAHESYVVGSGDESTGFERVGAGWFCFVEKPGIYWFFDGRNLVRVHSHGPAGGPQKSIIDGRFVNRDNPKVPDEVLARLPVELSKRLSSHVEGLAPF